MKILLIILFIFIGANAQNSRFVNKKSVILDIVTSKMWQKKSSTKNTNWNNAKKYCKSLRLSNFSNWRLPRVDELMSLIDKSRYNSSVSTEHFSNIKNEGFYWSKSIHQEDKKKAWLVFFKAGYSTYYYKNHVGQVLCVRDMK